MSNPFSEKMPEYLANGFEAIKDLPEIKRIKECASVKSMELVGEHKILAPDLVVLWFDVVAPAFFPNLRKSLIENKLAKRHNFLPGNNQDPSSGVVKQRLGFYRSSLQLVLNFKKETPK